MLVVIVIPVVLCRLANDGPDTRARCSTDQCALQAPAEDRSQRRAPSPANQRAFTRADPALILIPVVIVMIAMIVLVVVVAAPAPAAHAVVVGTVVIVLSVNRRKAGDEQKKSRKDRFT